MNRRRFIALLPLPFLSARIALSEDGEVSIPEGECEIECWDENMNTVPCLDPCPVEEPEAELENHCEEGDYECYGQTGRLGGYSPHVVNDVPVIVSLPQTGTGG